MPDPTLLNPFEGREGWLRDQQDWWLWTLTGYPRMNELPQGQYELERTTNDRVTVDTFCVGRQMHHHYRARVLNE